MLLNKTNYDEDVADWANQIIIYLSSKRLYKLLDQDKKHIELLAEIVVDNRNNIYFDQYRLNIIKNDFKTLMSYMQYAENRSFVNIY